jgi:hypothetical protein
MFLVSAPKDWFAVQENVPAAFGSLWIACLEISLQRKPMLERMLIADMMGVPIRLWRSWSGIMLLNCLFQAYMHYALTGWVACVRLVTPAMV